MDKLLLWKKIKNNGATRKRRRDLVANIISPKTTKIVPSRDSAEKSVQVDIDDYEQSQIENNEEFETEPEIEINIDNNSAWESELDDDFDVTNISETIENRNVLLKQSLAHWSASHGITLEALGNLLKMLSENIPEIQLPKDPRSIVKTPSMKTVLIPDNFGGSYWHYGLEKALKNSLDCFKYSPMVELNINFDGLPVFKTSRAEFWPILFNIHGKPEIPPMVIGIYFGKGW